MQKKITLTLKEFLLTLCFMIIFGLVSGTVITHMTGFAEYDSDKAVSKINYFAEHPEDLPYYGTILDHGNVTLEQLRKDYIHTKPYSDYVTGLFVDVLCK